MGSKDKGFPADGRRSGSNGQTNRAFVGDRHGSSFDGKSAVYVIDGDSVPQYSTAEAVQVPIGYPDVQIQKYTTDGYPEPGPDYRDRLDDGRGRSKSDSLTRNKNKPKESPFDESCSEQRRCMLTILLVTGCIIIAGLIVTVTLYFVGFFASPIIWEDGYEVEAIFSNSYEAGLTNKTTIDYTREKELFKDLTEGILDKSSYKTGYRITLTDILFRPGSTKYLFTLELSKTTDAQLLKTTLEDGYRNALENGISELQLLEVIISKHSKYTTSPAITTLLHIEIPQRTTPSPVSVCKLLQEEKCVSFGYEKIGSENARNFADLELLVSQNCYSHALQFACVSSYPPCEDNRQKYPCKQFCEEFRTNCSFPLPCEAYLDDDSADLCYLSPEPTPTEETVTRNPLPESCESYEFQCGTGNCMPSNVQCDGNEDCVDNSDELFCQDHTDIGLDCDFSDNNICSYTNDDSGHFYWMLNKGRTPSLNTGPLTDHTRRNDEGLYLYAEASGQYAYSVARIKSTQVSPGTDWCLRFYYHMFGDQIGALKVYQSDVDSEDERLLWQRSRDQGDKWIFSAVTLPAGTYHVIFEAIRGEGYKSDIAIDDITAREGACPQTAQGCSDDQFSCDNGNCIQQSYVCNSVNDCGDYSDERSCNCTSSEFQCEIGMCIPLYLRCDSKKQCPDGSDEDGCDSVCSNGRHKCNDGTCILPEWVCDHESDCPDNSDEVNCPICASGEWQCRDNKCVMESMVCDGRKDCVDGSDEVNCFRLSDDGLVEVRKRSPDHWTPICSYGFKAILYDDICKLVGHEKSTSHDVKLVTATQYVRYSESSVATNLLQQLVAQDSCLNNEVITITCSEKDCGQPTDDRHIEAYIVHGNDATIGQWPWQIALYVYHQSTWLFSCGGSLVSHYHVITAAHCVKLYSDPAMYKVVLGKTLLNAADTGIEVAVSGIVKHPGFTSVEWGDDIAILVLEKYIAFNQTIKPICLPNSVDEFPLSSQCYVSGWGKTDFYNSSSLPVHLQETKMKLWSDDQCSVAYINYNNKMVCAGYESGYTGNCQGDSGGPLQCRDVHGRWKLYGVFSYFVVGCNIPLQPPVFTRVKSYLNWIEEGLECAFVCDNLKCLIDASARCNGIDDCGDMSDETNCNTSLTCTFDDAFMCGYTSTSVIPAASKWNRVLSLFSSSRGPITDHTKGDGTGYFMFAAQGNSYLLSPITTLSSSGCLEFSLHGRIVADLYFGIVTVPDNVNHPSKVDITRTEYKGIHLPVIDMWKRVREDLPAGRFVVVFKSPTGFTSIDDAALLEGSCSSQTPNCLPGEVFCDNMCVDVTQICNYHTQCFAIQDEASCTGRQASYQCDLENYRDCHLEQESYDNEDWTWFEPSALQTNGPSNDHSTTENGGHVLFLNTKLSIPGHFAVVSLPVKVPLVSCLGFYYDMNSSGTLLVMACAGSKCHLLFHKQSTETAGWQDVQLELETAVTVIQIYGYVGQQTDSIKNYIALDDISIKPGLCSNTTCRPDQFTCANGECIIKALMCDNKDDCTDNSDEEDSLCKDITKMSPDMFRCDDGTYRQRHLRCDGLFDCSDHSDEINCTAPYCKEDEFQCLDGKCKNIYSKKDGYNDCSDGSDESGGCESYQFTCASGQCIAGFRYCDGNVDCPDASDEPVTGCQCNPRFHFTCGDGKCIPKEFACDGDNIAHCSDLSDENPDRCIFTCQSDGTTLMLASQVCNAIPQCPLGEDEVPNCECPFGYLPCVYGGCVPETKICDGHYDCYDHSDEANCTCTGDRPYRCESGMCLPQTARCNQIVECDDWSDELNCSPDPGCPDGYFACKNGVCVRNDVKCDGQDDCGDISDEINCDCNPVKEYKCEADGVCIPLSWKCDRINDCSDRADEEATCGGTCNPDQFQCDVMEYSCISSTLRCNGVYDCSDGSDEKSCERFSEAGLFEVLNNSEWITICSSGWSTQWNNDVCRHIGKGATIQASEVAVTKDKYLIVKPGLTDVTNPVFTLDMLQLAEDCPTNKGIYLSCAEPVCGVMPSPPSALIIGGQTSSPNTWPWMAAILHAGKPLCGAALIDSQWLITAAHCFKSQLLDDGKLRYTPHYIKVVTGTTKLSYPNTTTARSDTSRLELDVQSIIIHPDFHVNTRYALFNDIALVKLKEPITDTNVKYICRPTKYDHLPNKAKCYTAGWGLVDYKIGNVRIEDLRETRLNLWENNECSRVWGTDVNTTIHLCAGSTAPRPTVCEGDSGGPLMCPGENGIWQLAGVTSFGQSNCGQTSDIIKPVIFTRLGTYSDWIDNQISTKLSI